MMNCQSPCSSENLQCSQILNKMCSTTYIQNLRSPKPKGQHGDHRASYNWVLLPGGLSIIFSQHYLLFSVPLCVTEIKCSRKDHKKGVYSVVFLFRHWKKQDKDIHSHQSKINQHLAFVAYQLQDVPSLHCRSLCQSRHAFHRLGSDMGVDLEMASVAHTSMQRWRKCMKRVYCIAPALYTPTKRITGRMGNYFISTKTLNLLVVFF